MAFCPVPDTAWLVVVNAASGRQEGDAIAALIRDTVSARGHQVSVRLVTHAEELEQTARQAAGQARDRNGLLVAVGGDGTLNTVAAAALEVARVAIPAELRAVPEFPFGPVVESRDGAGPTERLANWNGRSAVGWGA